MSRRKQLIRPFVVVTCLACSTVGDAVAEEYVDSRALDEIIVTAQKRGAENLQDLAMSAAAITSGQIGLRQLVGMQDYLRTIPGVTHQEYGAGRTTTVIRGISADPQEGVETTGTYINESPLTGLSDFGTSSPELKLIDINRVEILRGPQGTLYGSSSLGGTVRVITEPPRLDEFSGSVAGTVSYTGESGSENHNIQGILNIPIIQDELAIRAVAYSYEYSGYYRNIAASDPVKSASAAQTGALAIDRNDVGKSTYTGGRITARWSPTDQLSVDLMYLEQQIEQEGVPYGDLQLDEFLHARYSRVSTGRSEYTEDDLSVLNLVIDYDFGPIGLVSSTSWINYENTRDWDVGQFWTFLYGDDAAIFIVNHSNPESFVQELRFASKWDHPVNFLAGLYFEDREETTSQIVEWDGNVADDPFNGALIAEFHGQLQFEQLAFFGELSWDISDALVATAGIRRFDYDVSFRDMGDGFILGGSFDELLTSKENGNTYKFNLSWSPDEKSLYYAQWADGFNPGFPIGEAPFNCDVDGDGLIDGLGLPAQEQIDSDTLDSYEVGSKLSFGGGRANVRGAAFYNQWKKIPIVLVADCAVGFPFNAGEAMTAGLELEGSAQIGAQWRMDFSAGYTKAELTSDAPGLGLDGDRLPGTPEYNAALGLQYDFPYRSYDGYVRGDIATVGGFYNNLQQQGEEIGGYTTVNLSSGLRLDNWDIQLFIKNLGNSSASTWIFAFDEYPSAHRLRPRTIGVSVRYNFEPSN